MGGCEECSTVYRDLQAAQREVQRLTDVAVGLAGSHARVRLENNTLRSQLSLVTAARDKACDLCSVVLIEIHNLMQSTKRWRDKVPGFDEAMELSSSAQRKMTAVIADLRTIGVKP